MLQLKKAMESHCARSWEEFVLCLLLVSNKEAKKKKRERDTEIHGKKESKEKLNMRTQA